MGKIQIQFANLSDTDFLDILGLQVFPEIGDTIEVAEGIEVVNGTLGGMGFTESASFQILYPVISGVAVNLFSVWLYERLKDRKCVQITIDGRKTNIDQKEIEAKLLSAENKSKNEHE